MENTQTTETPYELFQAIEKIDYNSVLKNIVDSNKLYIEQGSKIDYILKEYLLGYIDGETFEASLTSITNGDQEEYQKILGDINHKIIEPVRDAFIKLTEEREDLMAELDFDNIENIDTNTSMDESEHQALYDAGIEIEGFVPKAPERKYGEEIFPNEDLSVHEKMLSEELAKTESKEMVEVPKKLEEIPQNFMEQKLGGVVRNTSSDSDQSIPAITKKEVEKFDPYREKI